MEEEEGMIKEEEIGGEGGEDKGGDGEIRKRWSGRRREEEMEGAWGKDERHKELEEEDGKGGGRGIRSGYQ